MVPVLASSQSMSPASPPAAVGEAFATCPGCHTAHPSLTMGAVGAGATWQCARCYQRWDAVRLASVAAYRAWDSKHAAASEARAAQAGGGA